MVGRSTGNTRESVLREEKTGDTLSRRAIVGRDASCTQEEVAFSGRGGPGRTEEILSWRCRGGSGPGADATVDTVPGSDVGGLRRTALDHDAAGELGTPGIVESVDDTDEGPQIREIGRWIEPCSGEDLRGRRREETAHARASQAASDETLEAGGAI